MHNNKHSIGNHYELIIKQVGNQEMKQNAEVKIENEEETSNQEEQKYQPSIQDDPSIKDEPSIVGEASIKDEPSILGEASIHNEPSIPENIPTPTSYARNNEYEDTSISTEEEGPLDLTMKPKKNNHCKQHNIFHCQQKEEKEYQTQKKMFD